LFFFFQAEDGIRDFHVTGVQTCALPISGARARSTEQGSQPEADGRAEWSVVWQAPASLELPIVFELWANAGNDDQSPFGDATHQIGRASCRERGWSATGGG